MSAQAAVFATPAFHVPAVPDTGPVHTLHPGDVVCAERGERIETLLGSCVAIVLTDPRRTVGAMCHIVHASPAPGTCSACTTHADVALDVMYRLLRERGITPHLCEAYVYGGGNMFPSIDWDSEVGAQNVQWVLDALAHDGIQVLQHDTGGQAYRRLAWTVGPGTPEVIAIQV